MENNKESYMKLGMPKKKPCPNCGELVYPESEHFSDNINDYACEEKACEHEYELTCIHCGHKEEGD